MGSYTFKWEHPADEVYVTGTFDDWGKTVKLDRDADGVFTKTVDLPASADNVYYKFVKDGEWVTSHTAPTETDSSGNTNNVLRPSDIVTTSSAAPTSSTAALAGAVPKEGAPKEVPESTPGAFPETPAAASSDEPKEFSVNPIPASSGLGNPVDLKPGEKVPDPSTINSNSIQSGVRDDPELKAQDEAKQKEGEQTFSVAPIPATSGLGNPVDLKPGERVPDASELTTNTVNSTVKLDKESYEKAPEYPGTSTGDQSRQLDTAGGAFGVPPATNNLIPESSLPIGGGTSAKDADPGVTVQSAAPESSTAALAGQVPKEPLSRRNVDEYKPDATAPASAGAVGGAAISSAAPESSTAALAGEVPKEGAANGTAGAVPEEVKESQKEAGFAPEASANPEAVKEKAAVEQELLKEVKPDDSAGEPAPTESAATAATAPSATPATAGTLEPPTETSNAAPGPSATTGVTSESVPEKSLPETPKKGADGAGVGRRLSASFKKVIGEGTGSAADTPSSTKTGQTTDTTATAGSSSTAPKGHKKRQSIFKKIKEAFK